MSAEERRESVIRAAMHRVRPRRLLRHLHRGDRQAGRRLAAVSLPALPEQAGHVPRRRRALHGGHPRRCSPRPPRAWRARRPCRRWRTAYMRLIVERPRAAADADADVRRGGRRRGGRGPRVRRGGRGPAGCSCWDAVQVALGADIGETTTSSAYGMLINTLAALGFPPEHRVWARLLPSARPTVLSSAGSGFGPVFCPSKLVINN